VKCGGSVKWWVTVGLQASPPWTAGSAIAVAVPHGRGNSDRGLRAFVAQAGPSKDHPIKPGGGRYRMPCAWPCRTDNNLYVHPNR
jgi:hypothetical protein